MVEGSGSGTFASTRVSPLTKRGFVSRQTRPDDGRATQAVLTDAGLIKVVETAPIHVHAVRELVIAPLSPSQLKQLGIAGSKIGQQIQRWNARQGDVTI